MISVTFTCDFCNTTATESTTIGEAFWLPDRWHYGCFGKDGLQCPQCYDKTYKEFMLIHPGMVITA